MRTLFLALALLAGPQVAQVPARGNVLVLLADDLGADSVAVYGIGTDLPNTPRIDQLAATGVRFANAWANPICSATRATLQTGRYAFRTGVGHLVSADGGFALPLDERILPEMLDDLGTGYAHAAFGKWHLGNDTVGGLLAPNLAGYSHYAGALSNFDSGIANNYFQFQRVVDGVPALHQGYATTSTVDDALAWIATAPEPWFCYVAFQGVHSPFHAPPARLHTVDLTNVGTPQQNPRPYYRAMVEALDSEIGRLVDGLGSARAHTTIFFAGDNGTPRDVAVPPTTPGHAKATAYQGGIHVPLIASAPWIVAPGRVETALVGVVDLFATIEELASAEAPRAPALSTAPFGIAPGGPVHAPFDLEPPPPLVDSISCVPYLTDPDHLPLREVIYAEVSFPSGFAPPEVVRRAIRGPSYKLIQKYDGTSGLPLALPDPQNPVGLELYDLTSDPQELVNLLVPPLPRHVQLALTDLVREMTDILD